MNPSSIPDSKPTEAPSGDLSADLRFLHDRGLLEPLLAAHDWPGNVRELQNVLERAALFPDRSLPDLVAEEAARAAALRDPGTTPPPTAKLSDVVRSHVRRVLALHNGNIAAAARALGVSRATVRAHST